MISGMGKMAEEMAKQDPVQAQMREEMKGAELRPYGNHILARPVKDNAITESGILVVGKDDERPAVAKVVGVGPGRVGPVGELVPIAIEAGMFVLHGKYQGTEIDVTGEKLLLLREEHILGVLHPSERVQAEDYPLTARPTHEEPAAGVQEDAPPEHDPTGPTVAAPVTAEAAARLKAKTGGLLGGVDSSAVVG